MRIAVHRHASKAVAGLLAAAFVAAAPGTSVAGDLPYGLKDGKPYAGTTPDRRMARDR